MTTRKAPTTSRSKAAPASLEAGEYLLRLDRMVKTLLSGKFSGADDLWRLQMDLLSLQREIQRAIKVCKTQRRSDSGNHARLLRLREARWHARRFGDAYAWVVLGLDRRTIFPLARNNRVAIADEDHGSRGLLAICEGLAHDGWGFPLLHDITDTLRVGDVSFVRPGEERSRQVSTFEVKTRVMSERPAEDGKTDLEYQVTVASPAPFDPAQGGRRVDQPLASARTPEGPIAASKRREDRRLDRQLERMSTALQHQLAQDNSITHIEGEKPLLSMTVDQSSSSSHWNVVRRLIRRARRQGYASECVDQSMVYAAFYASEGLDQETIKKTTLPQDVIAAGLLTGDDSRDSIVITSVPAREGPAAHLFLPYFLYPIPRTAVLDLLHGRMALVVLLNPARVYAALEGAGFEVRTPGDKHDLSAESFVVIAQTVDGEGRGVRAEMHALGSQLTEMIYEFKGIDSFVEVAREMSSASAYAFAERSPERRRQPSASSSETPFT